MVAKEVNIPVALGALRTAGLGWPPFSPRPLGGCLGWCGRVLLVSASASSFLYAWGDCEPTKTC